MKGFVRTKTRFLKWIPLKKISRWRNFVHFPFMWIARMPGMFLEIDERWLNWPSFKEKYVFQKKDIFLNDVGFLKRRLF